MITVAVKAPSPVADVPVVVHLRIQKDVLLLRRTEGGVQKIIVEPFGDAAENAVHEIILQIRVFQAVFPLGIVKGGGVGIHVLCEGLAVDDRIAHHKARFRVKHAPAQRLPAEPEDTALGVPVVRLRAALALPGGDGERPVCIDPYAPVFDVPVNDVRILHPREGRGISVARIAGGGTLVFVYGPVPGQGRQHGQQVFVGDARLRIGAVFDDISRGKGGSVLRSGEQPEEGHRQQRGQKQ